MRAAKVVPRDSSVPAEANAHGWQPVSENWTGDVLVVTYLPGVLAVSPPPVRRSRVPVGGAIIAIAVVVH